jgi:hypothetical protein
VIGGEVPAKVFERDAEFEGDLVFGQADANHTSGPDTGVGREIWLFHAMLLGLSEFVPVFECVSVVDGGAFAEGVGVGGE